MFCQSSVLPFLIRCLVMCLCVFLKGLNTLQNLKELNLADNNIEKIGRFLESSVFSVLRLIEVQ